MMMMMHANFDSMLVQTATKTSLCAKIAYAALPNFVHFS